VDHFEVLSVTASSTATEVRKAYRQMALKVHPDKGGTKEAF